MSTTSASTERAFRLADRALSEDIAGHKRVMRNSKHRIRELAAEQAHLRAEAASHGIDLQSEGETHG